MRQRHCNNCKVKDATLRAIRGGRVENIPCSVIPNLTETAWTFAKSCLWNTRQFSSKECGIAKQHINHFLRTYRNPHKGFSVFCQRIQLAHLYYLDISCGVILTLPSVWLNREQGDGFPITKVFFDDVQRLRESLPAHKRTLKALAEAVLEYSECPSARNYQYWTDYFKVNEPGYLDLFQLFVVNFLYTK